MAFLKQLWLSVKGNPYFVAFEGGVYGAILNYLYDASTTGHLDFTAAGFHKLIAVSISGGIVAVRMLYRTPPGSNPNPAK